MLFAKVSAKPDSPPSGYDSLLYPFYFIDRNIILDIFCIRDTFRFMRGSNKAVLMWGFEPSKKRVHFSYYFAEKVKMALITLSNTFYIFSRFHMGKDRFCQLLEAEVPVWVHDAFFCSGRK